MPGSSTTPGRTGTRDDAPTMLPSVKTTTSAPGLIQAFAAQWPAYVLPYRRFVVTLASANARLGADADRYSFTVVDFHHLLLASLTGAPIFMILVFLTQDRCGQQPNGQICRSLMISGCSTLSGIEPKPYSVRKL
jgi:hypothetical protein